MGQRRKKRYTSKPNAHQPITLTGRAGLKYAEEFMLENIGQGDLQFFLFTCSMGREEEDPGYGYIGGSGYLKARIYDGKEWQPIVMDDLFSDRIHHFSKKEMPMDTFLLCRDEVAKMAGMRLQRSYRMHYEPIPYEDTDEAEDS
jgi:hypothetical protein